MKAGAIAALILVLGLQGEAQATSLRGTTRDAETHEPIQGAFITLQILDPDSISVNMVSGADGSYGAQDIVSGDRLYVLLAAAPGYSGLYVTLDALNGNDLVYDLLLTKLPPPGPDPAPPDSGRISGTVMALGASPGNLTPLAGATVTVTSGGFQIELHTDAVGHYAAELPLATYRIQFEASGYVSQHVSQIALEARGNVVDSILKSSATPTRPVTWGSMKGKYR
jgi:hypothetical protein